ncbi:hypothetical protein NQ317_008047, partial [Molorchus minor]
MLLYETSGNMFENVGDAISDIPFGKDKALFKEKTKDKLQEIGLNREEFLSIMCTLFENTNYSLQSLILFDEIAKGSKKTIVWNDMLDFLMENLILTEEPNIRMVFHRMERVPHIKGEIIVKIVLIETDKYFCYAVASMHGQIGLYDGYLNFLTSYYVIMTSEDITRSEAERRRRNGWITDAIFCEDVLMFIVTNSARSIMIYEASGLTHVPYWLILGVPNIVK